MRKKNRTILVLDDDPTVSIVVRGLLQSSPYRMIFVSTIEKAKDLLKSEQIDIFLTDVHLPDGNSLDYFEDYKKYCADLSIIVMTKFNNETVTSRAWRQGAVEFIEKPIDRKHLMHALQSVTLEETSPIKLQHRQLTSQLFHFIHDRDIPVFDAERLEKKLGYDKRLCQVALESYLTHLEESQREIFKCVGKREDKAVSCALHRFKGASETVTAFRVAHALKQMEKTIQSGGILTEYDCHELFRLSVKAKEKIQRWLAQETILVS